jgi:iron(III) transport system ATP-binding protein
MSNVVTGKTLNGNHLDFAGIQLRVSGETLQSGEGAVSIRQHQIRLLPAEPATKDNIVAATVVRQVFLGSSRDYMVEVAGGTQLRVVTSPGEDVPQGSTVWLHLPAEHCRALIA